jgi:integrase/recombinase XerC
MLRAVESTTDQANVLRPVEELLRLLMVGKSESTRQTYQADIEAFGRFMGFQRPQPGVAQILDRGGEYAYNLMLTYTGSLEEKGLQNASINKKLAPIRSLLSLAKNSGRIDWAVHLPYRKVQAYRDTRGPGSEGWKRLISAAEKRTDSLGRRNVAILRLMHDLALRRIEVKRLDLEDVDIINCRIAVLGKGCTQKVSLDVPPIVMAALSAWIEFRGTAPGPLFIELDRKAGGKCLKLRQESNVILPDGRNIRLSAASFGEGSRIRSTSFSRLVTEVGKPLGIKVTPHSLRHAGITAAVAKAAEIGVTIPEVMQFSRHKNLKTLQVYVDQHRNVQGRIAEAVSAG